MDENRKRALTAALSQIEKQFGKGTVMRMGDRPSDSVDAVSTGSLALDVALGIGGLPRGSWAVVYGRDPPGKPPSTRRGTRRAQMAVGPAPFSLPLLPFPDPRYPSVTPFPVLF